MTVMFRGKSACECLAAWLPVYEDVLLQRGVIQHNIDIYQLIGVAKASAGTHIPGGAYDVAQVSDEAILVAREMGAAAWHRRVAQGFDEDHQHGVLRGCPHNAGGRYQIGALDAGFNGLGHLGRGGPDDGPRTPVRTWQQGIAWAREELRVKNATTLTLALGNIRSTPRMTLGQEQAATAALFSFAGRIGAGVVVGNEIDHASLRRVWRERAGIRYATYGCAKGSENAVSVAGINVGSALVRWLSNGVPKVTPTRTVTVVSGTVGNASGGLKVKVMATHLVSWWQPYAKPKAARSWDVRAAIARRSTARLKKRIDMAVRRGWLVVLLGDVNAVTTLQVTDGQVQLLGTGKGAGGDAGKMLQAAAFVPEGVKVTVQRRWTEAPVATDHPYRGVRIGVTW